MWGKRVLILLLFLLICGLGVREYKKSLGGWQKSRFNMVYIDPQKDSVWFVTFDPVEQKMQVIEFPPNLAIKSRSVGEYKIENLYKLGSYQGSGGEFGRRKVQGFMRVPIQGYVVGGDTISLSLWKSIWQSSKRESNLSRIDSYFLWRKSVRYSSVRAGEEELVRAGVLKMESEGENYGYVADRLSQYVGKRLFDWGVGREGVSVAVLNGSGIDGMGSDLASFLTNMGLDVIMVRSESQVREKSEIVVREQSYKSKAISLIERVFDFAPARIGNNDEYRAEIVFYVGKDATSLF